MSENTSFPSCSKKRKIEYVFERDNTNEPLLTLDHSLDNQLTESQHAEEEFLDLTLSEELPQRIPDEETWTEITHQTVKDMLKQHNKAEYDVPGVFLAKLDEGVYQGVVKCDKKECKPFVSREMKSKRKINIKLSHRKSKIQILSEKNFQ